MWARSAKVWQRHAASNPTSSEWRRPALGPGNTRDERGVIGSARPGAESQSRFLAHPLADLGTVDNFEIGSLGYDRHALARRCRNQASRFMVRRTIAGRDSQGL